MTKDKFNQFTEVIARYFSEQRVLVGSKIFDAISELEKEQKTNYNFIKCDLLDDRVIFFSDRHPLSGYTVLVDDVIALDVYVRGISSTGVAMINNQDKDIITIVENMGNITILELNNNEITSQQQLIQP